MQPWSESQQQRLNVWQQHCYAEFVAKDVDLALTTMTDDPYVLCVPVGTGGYGIAGVRRFYGEDFFPVNPPDIKLTTVALTIAEQTLVEEAVISFTHDIMMPWLLPGIAPTGRAVEFAFIGVIGFRGDKIVSERLYWDQATLLVQLGVLDPATPTVRGVEAARLLLDPSRLR